MKCRVCREPAVIDVRRHNANFCTDHFFRYCSDQVQKAIHDHKMIATGDKVLVAVSGGKDSLALWQLLVEAGYAVDGLYIGLGIGEYSEQSHRFAADFAERRSLRLITVDIEDEHGFNIPSGSKAARRTPCSACGLTKRHVFDQVAIENGYDVLATGHNLDDEAAVLFGNVIRWEIEYLGRQSPVLEARSNFPKKVKPLIRLAERELAAYCVLSGIDYIVDECPMAAGNRHLGYKSLLNTLELTSPGTKAAFYHGFLAKGAPYFAAETTEAREALGLCSTCGAPSPSEICAFCRLVSRAQQHKADGTNRSGSVDGDNRDYDESDTPPAPVDIGADTITTDHDNKIEEQT